MTQLEIVALWAGLLSSVVGIVLSVVAIVFTWVVNKRADRMSDHTIQALQKIESSVEGLSESTKNLIKAAWDKMLGGFGTPPQAAVQASVAKEMAAGAVAEIQSELEGGRLTPRGDVDRIEESAKRIDDLLARLASTLEPAPAIREAVDPWYLDYVVTELKGLSPEASELLLALRRGGHLTKDQYQALAQSPLRDALVRLRDVGLIVPRQGHGGDDELVYYYPSGVHHVMDRVEPLLPPSPSEVREVVQAELEKTGYRFRRPRRSRRQD